MNKGLWVLAGLLIFVVLEKVFTCVPGNVDNQMTTVNMNVKQEDLYVTNNNVKELVSGYANGHCTNFMTSSNTHEKKSHLTPVRSTPKKVYSLSIRLHCRQSRLCHSDANSFIQIHYCS